MAPFLQNRLSVFDRGGEHLLPVLRYSFEVKFVNVCIILRVGVHHQTLQQRFVIRLDEYRHKAFFDTFPFGIEQPGAQERPYGKQQARNYNHSNSHTVIDQLIFARKIL